MTELTRIPPPVMPRPLIAILLCLTDQAPAFAADAADALGDLTVLKDTDPQGFWLMVMCVVLLATLGLTLILTTASYAYRRKAKK